VFRRGRFLFRGLPHRGAARRPAGPAGRALPRDRDGAGLGGKKKDLFGFPSIAGRFNALGYVTLACDYRGVGESEGERGRLLPRELVEDLRSAVTYLAQRSEVDPRRIALWGTSFGGATVPYAAALDPRVCASVSIAGFGDGCQWIMGPRNAEQRAALERRLAADQEQRVLSGRSEMVAAAELFAPDARSIEIHSRVVAAPAGIDAASPAITLESAERILEFRPASVVDWIAPRPILFIAAQHDAVTPLAGIEQMHRSAREPKRLEVIAGATHYEIYEEPYVGRIIEWTDEWLSRRLSDPVT
jgi:hypothetical protein